MHLFNSSIKNTLNQFAERKEVLLLYNSFDNSQIVGIYMPVGIKNSVMINIIDANLARRMNYFSIFCNNPNMLNVSIIIIEECKITWFRLGKQVYGSSCLNLFRSISWNAYAKNSVHSLGEARTINSPWSAPAP